MEKSKGKKPITMTKEQLNRVLSNAELTIKANCGMNVDGTCPAEGADKRALAVIERLRDELNDFQTEAHIDLGTFLGLAVLDGVQEE